MQYRHRINSPAEALDYLNTCNDSLCIQPWAEFNQQVLKNEAWLRVPASINHHSCPAHVTEGGLLIHTAQVAMTTNTMLQSMLLEDEDQTYAYALTAVIWHDFGKIYEYELQDQGGALGRVYGKSAYYKEVGHVAGSYLAFTEAARAWNDSLAGTIIGTTISTKSVEIIQHAILAHHGRMEWDSPKEPQNALAWAIHAADMMSAHFSN